MALTEERLQILKLLEEGKITADEAAKLLTALESGAQKEAPSTGSAANRSSSGGGGGKARWLRVRVTDQATGKQKVTVNLPVSLMNVGLKMGARFAPDMEGLNMEEILAAIQEGAEGKVVDVVDDEDGEHVEIFVE